MLHQLTDTALVEKSASLRAQVAELDRFISDTARARTARIVELENKYLPNLSRKVMAQLDAAFPKFLANVELAQLFRKNIPTLGLFKPARYDMAFALIRAQFRAHLTQCGELAWFDQTLRDAERRKTELTREFVAVESERHRRTVSPQPARVIEEVLSPVDDFPSSSSLLNNILVTQLLLDDDEPRPPVAQAVEIAVRQECVPAEDRPCIATDDRLGYFS